jgi:DNA-binding CsgD family transcriptional regulator
MGTDQVSITVAAGKHRADLPRSMQACLRFGMLQGRDPERSRITKLLDEGRASRGGALVLHGQPGVGKSALLLDARARAEDMQILTTQGIESESPLAFAALQRLLQPVMGTIAGLPAVQAGALRAAFGLDAGQVGDRFLVFLGALGVLSSAADQGPVLCLIDDAHWLDDTSAAALQFAARRLGQERIAMLFAARDGDVRRFDHSGLPDLALAGLDDRAAHTLLAARTTEEVAASVTSRLIELTGGNPLALAELPSALSSGQLAGTEPLPANLPITEGLQNAFLDRYRRLGADARAMLLVAAADGSTRMGVVQEATARLGCDARSVVLDEAEGSGLLKIVAGRVEFRHPLVRSAIYQASTSSARHRVHRALAEALASPDDLERRAWHLAEAATGPDAEVAAALDQAAERAQHRGGYEAASSAFERAAALTDSDDPRARRLLAAATAAWLGGQPGRAGALAEEGGRRTTEPVVRADLDRLRGRAEFHVGSVPTAVRVWTQAARDVAGVDRTRALELAVLASAASGFAAATQRTDLDPAELSADLDLRAPRRERCLSGLLIGFHHLLHGSPRLATAPLRAAFEAADSGSDPDLANAIGIAAFQLGEDEPFRQTFTSLLGHARHHGAYGLVLFALPRLALADWCAGRLGDAVSHASEARQLAAASGQPSLSAMPLAELALYAAVQGDSRFEEYLAELDQVLARHQVGVLGALVADARRWALGEHDHVAGRYADALHHLEQLTTPPLIHLAGYARVDAAVRADRPELARSWVAELDAYASAVEAPPALALVAYGTALLADADADEHFRMALAHHAHSGRPLEAARTRLAFGEFLRRRRQRVSARDHLREALKTFEDVGATPWAERARQELRASGETARRRDPSAAVELTPQERQIARFVASGLSNRDVAAQLFLSPRTVDFHLRNVFAKAGVSSRGELAKLELA